MYCRSLSILIFLGLGCTAGPDDRPELVLEPPADAEVRVGELILDIDAVDHSYFLADHDLELIRILRDGRILVQTPASSFHDPSRRRLARDMRIRSAQPNYIYRGHAVPNDPYIEYQTHLIDVGAFGDLGGRTGAGTVVAVLDTGLRTGGTDGLGDVMDGYDFIDGEADPSSEYDSHGTMVAAVIGQATNNGTLFAGAAPGATILPVRVLVGSEDPEEDPIGCSADLVDGIHFALDEGADVINMSLGGTCHDEALEDAVQRAEDEGVLMVASVGNEGTDQYTVYPASYETVLAVAATDLYGFLTYYSNYGELIDIAAPGGTFDDLNYDGLMDLVYQEGHIDGVWGIDGMVGTSFSAPLVSAAGAILIEVGLTEPADIRMALTEGAWTATDPFGYTGDASNSWPLLDIPLAIERAEEILWESAAPGDFNLDGVIDSADIDYFSLRALTSGGLLSAAELAHLDLDGDGSLDTDDRTLWIEDIVGTRMGDLDLDLDVDTFDLTTAVIHFWPDASDCDVMSTPDLCRIWENGDFDGDGDVDTADITQAIIHFHYGT
jgi:hypothetical protein